jgi:hypothetical protein
MSVIISVREIICNANCLAQYQGSIVDKELRSVGIVLDGSVFHAERSKTAGNFPEKAAQ